AARRSRSCAIRVAPMRESPIPSPARARSPPDGRDTITGFAIKRTRHRRPEPARRAPERLSRDLLTAMLVGAAYFGLAKLGLSFSAGHAIVSAVWPPSGVALACVVIFGARVWPGIFLGALLANATGDSALGTAAGIATGNAMACVLGGYLLGRAGF